MAPGDALNSAITSSMSVFDRQQSQMTQFKSRITNDPKHHKHLLEYLLGKFGCRNSDSLIFIFQMVS
jgi:hypothetical protein